MTNRCLKAVVVGRQGMLSVEYFSSTSTLFVPVKFCRGHTADVKVRKIWPPSVLVILSDLKEWCLS